MKRLLFLIFLLLPLPAWGQFATPGGSGSSWAWYDSAGHGPDTTVFSDTADYARDADTSGTEIQAALSLRLTSQENVAVSESTSADVDTSGTQVAAALALRLISQENAAVSESTAADVDTSGTNIAAALSYRLTSQENCAVSESTALSADTCTAAFLHLSGSTDDLTEGSSNLYDQALPDSGNWSTAYSWGDHSGAGYLTTQENCAVSESTSASSDTCTAAFIHRTRGIDTWAVFQAGASQPTNAYILSYVSSGDSFAWVQDQTGSPGSGSADTTELWNDANDEAHYAHDGKVRVRWGNGIDATWDGDDTTLTVLVDESELSIVFADSATGAERATSAILADSCTHYDTANTVSFAELTAEGYATEVAVGDSIADHWAVFTSGGDPGAAIHESLYVNTPGYITTVAVEESLNGYLTSTAIGNTYAPLTQPTFNDQVIVNREHDTPATGPLFDLRRERDGDPTQSVSSGDYLGEIRWRGYHTDGYYEGAIIRAIVDATPGSGDMPGRLEFATSADGSGTPTTRMVIDKDGIIYKGAVAADSALVTVHYIEEADDTLSHATVQALASGIWTDSVGVHWAEFIADNNDTVTAYRAAIHDSLDANWVAFTTDNNDTVTAYRAAIHDSLDANWSTWLDGNASEAAIGDSIADHWTVFTSGGDPGAAIHDSLDANWTLFIQNDTLSHATVQSLAEGVWNDSAGTHWTEFIGVGSEVDSSEITDAEFNQYVLNRSPGPTVDTTETVDAQLNQYVLNRSPGPTVDTTEGVGASWNQYVLNRSPGAAVDTGEIVDAEFNQYVLNRTGGTSTTDAESLKHIPIEDTTGNIGDGYGLVYNEGTAMEWAEFWLSPMTEPEPDQLLKVDGNADPETLYWADDNDHYPADSVYDLYAAGIITASDVDDTIKNGWEVYYKIDTTTAKIPTATLADTTAGGAARATYAGYADTTGGGAARAATCLVADSAITVDTSAAAIQTALAHVYSADDDSYPGDSVSALYARYEVKSFIIENPDTLHRRLWKAPEAITIDSVFGICEGGTNIVGALDEYSYDGSTLDAAVDADWTITTSMYSDGSFTNAALDAMDWLGWHTTSVSGSVASFTLTIYYHQ